MIIDQVTGKNHADLLKERIFDKADMTHTNYYYHQDVPEYTAQGYYDLYNNN